MEKSQLTRPIHLLCVDDEQEFLLLLEKYLDEKHEDLHIKTENVPTNVLGRLQEERIDVIVSDYQMVEMSGLDLFRVVRAHDPHIPFIMLTGKSREELAIEALNMGVDYFMQKSTNFRTMGVELKSLVVQAMAKAHYRQECDRNILMFNKFLELAPFPVAIVGANGNPTYLNDTFTLILGYTLEDLPDQQSWLEKAYPDKTYQEKVVQDWDLDRADLSQWSSKPRMFHVKCKNDKVAKFTFYQIKTAEDFFFIILIPDK